MLAGARDITSSEYYTFAELALIIFYVAGIVGESVYKEKQLTTINRIRLSRMKESFLIGAKVTSWNYNINIANIISLCLFYCSFRCKLGR